MGQKAVRLLWVCIVALAAAGCAPGPEPTNGTVPATVLRPATPTSIAIPSGEVVTAVPVTPAPVTPVPVPPTADPSIPAALARQFVQDLLDRDYASAWSMLAPLDQEAFGTEEAFASDRAAFMQSAGREIVIGDPSNAPDQLALWLVGISDAEIQADRAFFVELDYVALRHTNSTPGVLLIAPDPADDWRIWIVR